MNNSYVSSHQDVCRSWSTPTSRRSSDAHAYSRTDRRQMPADYYAGNKALYVTALQNQMAIFSPDGLMPAVPAVGAGTEYQSNLVPRASRSISPRRSPTRSPRKRPAKGSSRSARCWLPSWRRVVFVRERTEENEPELGWLDKLSSTLPEVHLVKVDVVGSPIREIIQSDSRRPAR